MSSLPQKSLIHSSPGGFQALGFVLNREELGFPVVRSSASIAGDVGSIPGWATKIPHAMCCSQQTNKEISLSLSLSLCVCVCVCVYLSSSFIKKKKEGGTATTIMVWFSSVQSLSRVQLFATPWAAACQASLYITNFQSLLKFMSIESVMPSNHLILYPPLILLPSIFPSIRFFSNESVLHIRWPKY